MNNLWYWERVLARGTAAVMNVASQKFLFSQPSFKYVMSVFTYFIYGLLKYAANSSEDIVLNVYQVKQFILIITNCHPMNYNAHKK